MFHLLVFIFGLLIGSFLNAVIHRLDTGESIVSKRSHCPKCGHTLSWYELIPVVSFIMQRGRCRACDKKISLQYPAVELGTASLFILIFQLTADYPLGWQFLATAYLFIITSLLIVIFVYDLKHYIIPDKIVFPAVGIALGYRVFEVFNFGFIPDFHGLLNPVISAFLASAFFAAIFFISRGTWMGFGDVKLAFLMGLILGWPNILAALIFAFILGGIVGIGLVLQGTKDMKSQVPFGPFLVAGTFVAIFWGKEIIDWYLALLI